MGGERAEAGHAGGRGRVPILGAAVQEGHEEGILCLGRAEVHGDVGGAREGYGALEKVEGERGGDEGEDASTAT